MSYPSRPTKPAPRGYVVIDEAKWAAQCNFMSERDIADLAENGLAKLGLKLEKAWLEEQGQVSMAEMFGELEGGW